MAVLARSWWSRLSLLRTLPSRLRLTMRLLREPRVPMSFKALPVLTMLYVVSPLDLIPDVFPLAGQIDDIGVMLIALELFARICPRAAVDFHRGAIAQGRPYRPVPQDEQIIDAEFTRDDGPS